MSRATLLAPEAVLTGPREPVVPGLAVAVVDGRIAAVEPYDLLVARWATSETILLGNCVLMPGLVNAHQHGRGLSQIQLGYPDTFLEEWIANRRGRGALDAYAITRLAAAKMVANGVTTTIHANYTYGSGDYESEVRASLAAYDEVGIRVTFCVGAMDRGAVVYPPHEACFLCGLPDGVRGWLASSRPGYAGDAAATLALMDRLVHDYHGHPRVRLCYGPAGPQWVTDELLAALARDAERRGMMLHMHALELPAQAAALRELYPLGLFPTLEKLGALSRRTVFAHGVYVNERDLEHLARSQAIVVRNAGSNLRLRNGIAPVPAYQRHGVRLAVGTDNAALADDEDMFKEMRLVGQLARVPDWNSPDPPDASDLLEMAVTNGLAAASWDDVGGTIEVGAVADLIAVSLSRVRGAYLDQETPVIEALVARAEGSDVRLTMVGGRILYRDGRHSKVDLAEVESKAGAAALAARLPRDPETI